jgi:hypothetical protein
MARLGWYAMDFYENTSAVITSHILKILKVKYIGPLILLPLYMLGLVDQ